jgi:Cell division protein FtsI/penicillin-binding protein 2
MDYLLGLHSQDTKIALTVIIENGGGGRLAAAPVAEKIMQAILDSEKKNAL